MKTDCVGHTQTSTVDEIGDETSWEMRVNKWYLAHAITVTAQFLHTRYGRHEPISCCENITRL